MFLADTFTCAPEGCNIGHKEQGPDTIEAYTQPQAHIYQLGKEV
jgi:hypothetical protein